MSDTTKNFNLNNVAVNFLAIPLGSGFGDGAAIKFEKTKPDTDAKEGADGSVAFFATNSNLWTCTITLLSTSSGNAKLSAIMTAAKLSGIPAVGPFFLADTGGKTLFTSPNATIKAWPNLDINAEPTNVEWVLWCADGVPFWGGN